MKTLGLGAHKSKLDVRDHKDKELSFAVALPDKYFVDTTSLGMRMQYSIGKCIGEGNAKKSDQLFNIYSSDDFIYLGAKSIDGNLIEGSSIRSALKFMQKSGVCLHSSFNIPVNYDMTYADYIKYKPSNEALSEAQKYKIGQYFSIPIDSGTIMASLIKYGILVARMDVGVEWYEPSWKSKDILPLRKSKNPISGHCVAIVGYDTTLVQGKTAIYIDNSWSSNWADNGRGYFFLEDYSPTEVWAVTLNPVPENNLISLEILQSIIMIFQKIGLWTKSISRSIINP